MSRSVRQDYDKMRELQSEGKVIIPFKVSAIIPMSEEMIFTHSGPAFERKTTTRTISPTNEDWSKYHRAKSGLLALLNYEGAGGLSEVEIEMPRPRNVYTYTETHEEWLDRCRTLQAERKAA